MSKRENPDPNGSSKQLLKSYPAPWKGELLLACSKCRKKLDKSKEFLPLTELKRELKKRAKRDTDGGIRTRVVSVSCLKMCPKDAITVCTRRQLARNECSILRTAKDIDVLYSMCKMDSAS